MEWLFKIVTVENFAMMVALFLLVKTTGSIEQMTKGLTKLTESIDKSCEKLQEHITVANKIFDELNYKVLKHEIMLSLLRKGADKSKQEQPKDAV